MEDIDDDIPLARILPQRAVAGAKRTRELSFDEDADDDSDASSVPKGRKKVAASSAKSSKPVARSPAKKKAAAPRAAKAAPKKAAAPAKKVAGVKAPPKKRGGVEDDDDDDKDMSAAVSSGPARRGKDMRPLEAIEVAMKAHKWWEEPELPKGVRWRTMEHNGVIFPPPYKPHGVKMLYDGVPVSLTPAQEEIATFYASEYVWHCLQKRASKHPAVPSAAVPTDGPHLGTARTAKVFNANFFKDFRSALGKDHVIQKLDLCDFNVRPRICHAPRWSPWTTCPIPPSAAHPRARRRRPGAQEERQQGGEGRCEGREGGAAAQARLRARGRPPGKGAAL